MRSHWFIHRHKENSYSVEDQKTLLARHRFAGNLKLPNEVLFNLSDDDVRAISDTLRWIVQEFKYNLTRKDRNKSHIENECMKFELSIDLSLVIDYINGNLNLYLYDHTKNLYSQLMDYDTMSRISEKKYQMTERFEAYIQNDRTYKSRNDRFAEEVHEIYLDIVNNRGSPSSNRGINIADDFDLSM